MYFNQTAKITFLDFAFGEQRKNWVAMLIYDTWKKSTFIQNIS